MRLTRRGRRALGAVAVLGLAGGAAAWALRVPSGDLVVAERCLASVNGTAHDLAPDQAANAATITGIAVRRGLPARAATIAIATAIQESKLRNLDYGDRDSLGLFQQRPSQGWGTPEQVMDPVYATNAFYDALVRVEGYADLEITDASDRVQRSAFPRAVADHEPQGRAFASALTGYSPAALTCRLRPASSPGDAGRVVELLTRDLGDVGATVTADEPARVTVPVGAGDAGRRRAWAVAHWAVAQAAGLDVVRVAVDGREWVREAPDAGWVQAPDAAAPGEVVIEVAAP
ncbi:MAG: hypothetical protein ACOYXW_08845 [Actinomycetota bacterium]